MAAMSILAVLYSAARIEHDSKAEAMERVESSHHSSVASRTARAVELLARAFQSAGWRLMSEPHVQRGERAELLVRRRGASYAIEIKVGAEGRSDRLIPLWSQAYVQASQVAGEHPPVAVVAAPKIAPRAAKQVLEFAKRYVPDAAAGVMDFEGLRLFRGPHLEVLNVELRKEPSWLHAPVERVNLFSDLNQWMLKVMLAPELPEKLLSAPRARYRGASQLAKAAGVSVMSASRFVQQLRREGYLHESKAYLSLVRRDHLFQLWLASVTGRIKEVRMRYLLRSGHPPAVRRQMLESGHACLALFAAAHALDVGVVEGVPDHVYVRRLAIADLAGWKGMSPAAPGEAPDLIVRQAPAVQSVFRGTVRLEGLACCDILQIWLDVSSHPSRGQEEADFIRRSVLRPLFEGSS